MPDWLQYKFEREKFVELLLYFCQRGIAENLVIGSTKLNKLLFFSDTRAYVELGRPITGARYQKLKWGPAPRALLPVRDELVETQQVDFGAGDAGDWNDIIIPRRAADISLFDPAELAIADAIFEELRHFNATAASDYSHLRSAGWRVVDYKEDIPYESSFVLTDPAPPEAIELGRELAAQYGW